MPWMVPLTKNEDKIAKRAARLYMETWDSTYDSVRRQLQNMGINDETIARVFRHLKWTD